MPQVTDDQIKGLADSLKTRTTETRWGIGTAAQYLKSVEGCTGDLFSPDDWQKAIDEAEGRLTYCDEEMGDTKAIVESVKDVTHDDSKSVPDGFLMTFDCTLTSKRKDRDGDVLEPSGMKVDENMPLLWQHLPMQPIGRLVKVLDQTDTHIKARFGVVDTAMGRDAAVLVKAGVLRMSHGFKPYEFEPIDHEKDGEKSAGSPSGWHVKSGEIREGSVVSIPSNVDGMIEAYKQGEFSTPLVKSWVEMVSKSAAKGDSDADPKAGDVAGPPPVKIDLDIKVNGQEIGVKADQTKQIVPTAEKTSDADDSGGPNNEPATGAEPASASEFNQLGTKMTGMDDTIEGSFEWIRSKLKETAADYIRARGHNVSADSWTELIATFAGQAVVCVHKYGSKDYPCYQIAWVTTNAEPQWTGEVVEVEIKPQVIEKAIASLRHTKDFKLSSQELIGAAIGMEPILAKGALESLQRDTASAIEAIRGQERSDYYDRFTKQLEE